MEHRTQNSPVIDLFGTSLGLSHFFPRILMPTQVVTRQREHRKLAGVVVGKEGERSYAAPSFLRRSSRCRAQEIQPLGILLSALIKATMA